MRRYRVPFSFLVVLLLTSPANAAYRVYQLRVTYYDFSLPGLRSEVLLTNLDPNQWADYHAEYDRAQVEMLDTWYCPGDTSHHDYCDKPNVNDRTPASTYPERNRLPYNLQPVIP